MPCYVVADLRGLYTDPRRHFITKSNMFNTVKRIKINFSFIALAVILTATFFLLFLGNFKYYKSEVSVLFIPKSERFAVHTPYILENLVRLPKNLAFYERMLQNNKDLSDPFAGQSKDDKKEMWNKILSIEKDDGSSIIKIGIAAKDKNQSQALAEKTARTLIDTASFYYNIKTDADFRIISGPDATSFIKYWYWLVLTSIILGTSSALALNFFFSALIKAVKNKKNQFQLPRSAEKQMPKTFSEKIQDFSKRSVAPENLPTAQFEETVPEDVMPEESYYKHEEAEKYFEPTEKELKERLNQLLRGEL